MSSTSQNPNSSPLPPPTLTHHILYLRLANSNVFRSISVPSNYTFRLLHRLIQYTFGWSDTHLHRFDLRHNCVFYKAQAKRTWVKQWGPTALFINGVFLDDDEEDDEIAEMYDNFGEDRVDERAVTIGQVWKTTGDGGGEPDKGTVLHYLYDFGDSWEVEIACTAFRRMKEASDRARILRAKGGPAKEVWKESDGEHFGDIELKDFDREVFNQNWERYLNGEVWTKARVVDVQLFEKDELDNESQDEVEPESEDEVGSDFVDDDMDTPLE